MTTTNDARPTTTDGSIKGDPQQIPTPSKPIGESKDATVTSDRPAMVLPPARRWLVISIASAAAFASPLTANIYLPALPDVARDLNVGLERVALSVTVFMIFQGLSPLWLGGSDSMGRRCIYTLCLILYAIANIGLALLPNGSYAGLMVLRCLQACGSASMIALGAGCISDITTSKDRGSKMGVLQASATIGPALGPVIGGLLAQRWGWRAIFWFLFFLGILILLMILITLPETMKSAATNKRIPLPLRLAWVDFLPGNRERLNEAMSMARPDTETEASEPSKPRPLWRRILNPLITPLLTIRYLKHPEIVLALIANCVPFASFYAVTTTLSNELQERYGLSTLQAGLVFLAPGSAISLTAILQGKLMDWDYKRIKAQWDRKMETMAIEDGLHGANVSDATNKVTGGDTFTARKGSVGVGSQVTAFEEASTPSSHNTGTKVTGTASPLNKMAYFPIEKARLRWYPLWIITLTLFYIGYGWVLQHNLPLAVPIVFTFLVGLSTGGAFSIFGTMLIDYARGKGAGITALNNVFRCLMGAVITAIVQYIVNGIDVGWTYTLFGFLCLVSALCPLTMYILGPKWRRARAEKELQRQGDGNVAGQA